MAKYDVMITVSFAGEIEADSEAHAEELAWTAWGENSDAQLTYFAVDNIDVEEIEEDDEDGEDD